VVAYAIGLSVDLPANLFSTGDEVEVSVGIGGMKGRPQ